MQMTNGEIVSSYKQANNKGNQIAILADLNGCDKDTIKKILNDAGLNVPLPKRGRPKKSNSASNSTEKIAPKKPKVEPIEDDCVEEIEEIIEEYPENLDSTHIPGTIPDPIRKVLEERLDILDEIIKDATNEYKEIVKFLSR